MFSDFCYGVKTPTILNSPTYAEYTHFYFNNPGVHGNVDLIDLKCIPTSMNTFIALVVAPEQVGRGSLSESTFLQLKKCVSDLSDTELVKQIKQQYLEYQLGVRHG